jgi:DUF971 family protein
MGPIGPINHAPRTISAASFWKYNNEGKPVSFTEEIFTMSASRPEPLRPVVLGKDGTERLWIEWNDGHRSVHTWKHLREECPCAGCKGEFGQPPSPLRILTTAELNAPPLAPVAMTPVGLYAYKITWNDGHDSGIYTLENLRSLCQCPECQSAKPAPAK